MARQPGDADWAPAPEVRRTIDIARASQAIELEPLPALRFGADPVALSAAAVSGLPVDFETDGPCRILDGASSRTGRAPARSWRGSPATPTGQRHPRWRTIDIARASQAIELEAVPARRFGADPVALSAAAVSGLPVDFETDGPCRILEGSLVTDGAGTCTIVAPQPGDADWAAAPESGAPSTSPGPARPSSSQPLEGRRGRRAGAVRPRPIRALPVTLETRGACLPDGASLRPIGSGTCSITVTQPGDDDWEPAEPVTVTTRIGRGGQTVRLEDVPDTVFGAEPLPITALSSSGLPVRLDAEGPCRVENGSLIADGAGICTVVAHQPGDIDWRPAVTVRRPSASIERSR